MISAQTKGIIIMHQDITEPFAVPEFHYDGVGHYFVRGVILKYTLWSWQIVSPDTEPQKVAIARLATNFDASRFKQSNQTALDAFEQHMSAMRRMSIIRPIKDVCDG